VKVTIKSDCRLDGELCENWSRCGRNRKCQIKADARWISRIVKVFGAQKYN
jgi:hypothetical protein